MTEPLFRPSRLPRSKPPPRPSPRRKLAGLSIWESSIHCVSRFCKLHWRRAGGNGVEEAQRAGTGKLSAFTCHCWSGRWECFASLRSHHVGSHESWPSANTTQPTQHLASGGLRQPYSTHKLRRVEGVGVNLPTAYRQQSVVPAQHAARGGQTAGSSGSVAPHKM